MSKTTIDLQWPHQVALLEAHCTGEHYFPAHRGAERLGVCVRKHRRRIGDDWELVFCFAETDAAAEFAALFNATVTGPMKAGWQRT